MATSVDWDHGSHDEFYEYYAAGSLASRTQDRFRRIRSTVLRVIQNSSQPAVYDVADIGCGAGTQSLLWAEAGHRVYGLDVNARLLELGHQRAAVAGLQIEFKVGSAVSLPWPDQSMDVCLVIELLEHVSDWQSCLKEFARVLRPGGALFLTTSNRLCPIQEEFSLPLYSWYPSPLKRWCERLAVTTQPWLANHATYPATNWFTFYELESELDRLGLRSMDRFDLVDESGKSGISKAVLTSIRNVSALRWLAHVATSGTTVLAIKRPTGS